MSAEFRQRTPGEYAQILWRRKWLIILPTIAVAVAVAWVVLRLPDVYESTTLLTVRPATISTSAVAQLRDDDLTVRINNIGQEVVSRTSLEPLIVRYNLYSVERRRGEPMETLVEDMRMRDISVKINTTRDDITNGFFLSFRGPDPKTTQAVTAELATKYVNAQTAAKTNESAQTKQFFEEKLRQAKEELDAIDRQRLQFMMSNVQSLPSTAPGLIAQLAGLREQQKALINEVGRLRDQRTMLTTQLGDLSKQRNQEIMNIAEAIGDPKATLGYAELVNRKAQLEAEKQNLLTTLRPKHPDVVSVQNQISSVQKQMNEMVDDNKRRIEEKRKQLEAQTDPRVNSIKYNLDLVKGEIARQEKELAQAGGYIATIDQRIGSVPGAEVGLEAINREYLSKKAVYDDLLKDKQKAELIADVNVNQQGETIAVIDPANLSQQPVAPQRPLLMLLGLALGLSVGVALVALVEVPRLLTIQTTEDAEHYTGLPVLVTLPMLLTPREERRLKARRLLFATAGIIITVASIPALALVLKLTRVFEIFAARG